MIFHKVLCKPPFLNSFQFIHSNSSLTVSVSTIVWNASLLERKQYITFQFLLMPTEILGTIQTSVFKIHRACYFPLIKENILESFIPIRARDLRLHCCTGTNSPEQHSLHYHFANTQHSSVFYQPSLTMIPLNARNSSPLFSSSPAGIFLLHFWTSSSTFESFYCTTTTLKCSSCNCFPGSC